MVRGILQEYPSLIVPHVSVKRDIDTEFHRQYYYAPMNPQYQSAAVMQLALAVLFDLGLNKPLRDSDGSDILIDTFRLAVDNAKEMRRSFEERRAYISCFIMSSTYATSNTIYSCRLSAY